MTQSLSIPTSAGGISGIRRQEGRILTASCKSGFESENGSSTIGCRDPVSQVASYGRTTRVAICQSYRSIEAASASRLHADVFRKSRLVASTFTTDVAVGPPCERKHRTRRGMVSAVITPERKVEGRKGTIGKEGAQSAKGARESDPELLRPLKPRGSLTLGEQHLVLDPYALVSDSDTDSDADLAQTKRKKVDPNRVSVTEKAKGTEATPARTREPEPSASDSAEASQNGSKEGASGSGKLRRSRIGRSFKQANGAVRKVKSTSEGVVSESVAKLTGALEKVVGAGKIGTIPVARIIAKGISGAVKGGAAASMAESVGMHVGGGQIEIAAFRGALTGAVADIVSLFIDPPAQEIGEGAVERGEQAAEEFEARLRKQSGGTMIIKREDTSDGSMGRILSVDKRKDSKKKGKKKTRSKEGSESEGKQREGGSSDSESEDEEEKLVRSDKTASEGVKEEGMVWGQLEERTDTTAVTVMGNAVDLGTKALSGAMKGAIWGAAQEASKQGFVPHGAIKGAISGAFGDTIASRVDPLAQKSQESINGREKRDGEGQKNGKAKGTIRRKVTGVSENGLQTKVMKEGEGSKENEVTEIRGRKWGGREVRVKSGARLQVVEKTFAKEGEKGDVEKVPFQTDNGLSRAPGDHPQGSLERAVVAGKEEKARASGEEEEALLTIGERFESGLQAVGDDVIPERAAALADVSTAGDDVSERGAETGAAGRKEGDGTPRDSEPGGEGGEKEVPTVTGVQLARPQSKSVDGLRVKCDHGCSDLDFATGFGGSDEVVCENVRLAEKLEAEQGVGLEVDGEVDNPVSEQLVLLKEKGVQMKKQEKGFWTEEQQAEAEKTALKKLTRALGGAVKGAATGAMTEMATTGTITGIGAVKGAVGGAVADLAADVADPIANEVGKDSEEEEGEGEEQADVEVDAELEAPAEADVDDNVANDRPALEPEAEVRQTDSISAEGGPERDAKVEGPISDER